MTLGTNYGYDFASPSAYGISGGASPYNDASPRELLQSLSENDPRRKMLEAMGVEDLSDKDEQGDKNKKPGYESSPAECKTCQSRTYKDGSNEMNVSFKNAAHIAPQAAASVVRSHEAQHVSNAFSKATQAGGKVITASVTIHTSICPECGRQFVSGGTTNTQIKYPNAANPYQQSRRSADSIHLRGANLDHCA